MIAYQPNQTNACCNKNWIDVCYACDVGTLHYKMHDCTISAGTVQVGDGILWPATRKKNCHGRRMNKIAVLSEGDEPPSSEAAFNRKG